MFSFSQRDAKDDRQTGVKNNQDNEWMERQSDHWTLQREISMFVKNS